MAERRPLPTIARRRTPLAPLLPDLQDLATVEDVDSSEAVTLNDYLPAANIEESAAPVKRVTPAEAASDGFVMDFEAGTPAPTPKRR